MGQHANLFKVWQHSYIGFVEDQPRGRAIIDPLPRVLHVIIPKKDGLADKFKVTCALHTSES